MFFSYATVCANNFFVFELHLLVLPHYFFSCSCELFNLFVWMHVHSITRTPGSTNCGFLTQLGSIDYQAVTYQRTLYVDFQQVTLLC